MIFSQFVDGTCMHLEKKVTPDRKENWNINVYFELCVSRYF